MEICRRGAFECDVGSSVCFYFFFQHFWWPLNSFRALNINPVLEVWRSENSSETSFGIALYRGISVALLLTFKFVIAWKI